MTQRFLFSRLGQRRGMLILLIGLLNQPLHAQSGLLLLDDQPASGVAGTAPSLGQQPFATTAEPNLTPSQTNTNQLNQLFQFETTPNICAADESYVTANLNYLKFPGNTKEYRYQIQGQYGVTDHLALGGFVPGVTVRGNTTDSGLGDIGLYAQYKLDNYINPETVDVTVQLDMILPTGDRTALRDTGKFGVRPLVLAYKDFGQHGPGILGVYGLTGFTITTESDFRVGVAATYQYEDLVGIIEFFDQTGTHHARPLVQITPGISYRGLVPWEISVGVPIGVNSGDPDWGIIFKLTYAFAN